MRQRRRGITVYLLVRVRGTDDPYERRAFRSWATSIHHAETLAREYASQFFDIGKPN